MRADVSVVTARSIMLCTRVCTAFYMVPACRWPEDGVGVKLPQLKQCLQWDIAISSDLTCTSNVVWSRNLLTKAVNSLCSITTACAWFLLDLPSLLLLCSISCSLLPLLSHRCAVLKEIAPSYGTAIVPSTHLSAIPRSFRNTASYFATSDKVTPSAHEVLFLELPFYLGLLFLARETHP